MNFIGTGHPIRLLLGPSGSESTQTQASTAQQVGVQGGTGVGAQNSGTAGNSGVTTTGSGDHISVTTSDPQIVEAAFSAATQTSSDALTALENVESNAAATNQLAIVGNANVSTAADQLTAGQPIGSAFGAGLSGNSLYLVIGGAFLILLLILRRN